jgi:malate synthase
MSTAAASYKEQTIDGPSEKAELDQDALHILPLDILPVETPGLKRAKLIKNARLDSVVELFRDSETGSGQVEVSGLGPVFNWPEDEVHPDETLVSVVCRLHSYDIYTLRIQLRKLGINVNNLDQLKLSKSKSDELTSYMKTFTLPLITQIYGETNSDIQDVSQLIGLFTSPDKSDALKNLKLMASKLEISLSDVPKFLEDYGDVFMSLAYYKNCLDNLIPKVMLYEEATDELKQNHQLSNDRRLMKCVSFISDQLSDITASITGRFESFDRHSEALWENITAESTREPSAGIELRGAIRDGYDTILTNEALAFLAALERDFGARRLQLLQARMAVQAKIDDGALPDFLPETQSVRDGDWKVAPIPSDLQDRRVEITGPVDRKMVINALNCGANVFMADFEDANTPTWDNQIQGQINLRDAVNRSIDFTDPNTGKAYALKEETATLIVRPRGWHLPEAHVVIDGAPMSGALFDFGLFFFHNAKQAIANGSGPYFYLPKLESHLEARLWNDVFVFAQDTLNIPQGSIKATVLIETIMAAFEMDEILYELRDHMAGLNCGRWDYIFSYIKKFRNQPGFVLPDRGQVTMTSHFLRSYSLLLIKTCHRRGAHAMGGMAAQIPIKGDAAANDEALAKVRADKEREANDGHDGTWVAHPGLVPIARAVFDEKMPEANQIARARQDVHISQADLLKVAEGSITEDGLRNNLNVGIQYVEAWLGGLGCVPIYNLMEDAATAEISRAQAWQWLKHGAAFDCGTAIDGEMVSRLTAEELDKIRALVGDERFDNGHYEEAAALFLDMVTTDAFEDFLTLPAYERVISQAA